MQGLERQRVSATDNIASANSLIKAGYTLYKPSTPWALSNSLYWKKQLRSANTSHT